MTDARVRAGGRGRACSCPSAPSSGHATATLVAADLHWGKGATFRAAGIPIPRGATGDDLARLDAALLRTCARRLVVLGDLFHARAGRIAVETLAELRRWREAPAGASRSSSSAATTTATPATPRRTSASTASTRRRFVPPFVLRHHPADSADGYTLAGHLHPGLRLAGPALLRERLPCFVVGPAARDAPGVRQLHRPRRGRTAPRMTGSSSSRRTRCCRRAAHVRSARRPLPDGDVARLPHHLRRGRHRHAGAHGRRRAALAAAPATRSTSSSPSAGPRARRSSSPSAPSRARCSRSSWACSGPASWSSPARIIGMPFSLEGFAFFTEAIFLGIYLYGWDRISPRAHLVGRRHGGAERRRVGHLRRDRERLDERAHGLRPGGRAASPTSIRSPAMLNPMAFQQTLHMTLAAYAATGFAVAGIHAFLLLLDPRQRLPPARARHRAAGGRARGGAAAALRRPQRPARSRAHQPAKLAAMEAHFETRAARAARDRRLARRGHAARPATRIQIPGGLSFLAFHDADAEVKGWIEFPRDDWPHVPIVHLAFQLMVGARHVHGARRRSGPAWLACPAPATCAPSHLVPPGARARGADGLHRHRGGLDGDRGRPAALDRLRRAAHRRRGDADAGPHRAVPRLHRCSTASSARSWPGCSIARSSGARAPPSGAACTRRRDCAVPLSSTLPEILARARRRRAQRVRAVRRRRLRRRGVGPARHRAAARRASAR